jgi:ABC-2 type transport system permease protein
MSDLQLALRQVRYTNKGFWRNPASAFFTFVFPLMFLVIFTAIFKGTTDTAGFGTQETSTYYIPAIAVFSIITATYTNLAISVTFLRDAGILKRVRGTPLPGWAYMLGRIIHAVLMSFLLVAIVIVFGIAFYHATFPTDRVLPIVATILVGAASFSALGLAVTVIVPNADAAPAVVNATVLPLLFLSGVFIPLPSGNPWFVVVAKFFPIYHFVHAMLSSYFVPTGNGWEGSDILTVAIWGVIGVVVAARRFRWEPNR